MLSLALLALAAGIVATWHGVSYAHDGGYYLAYARAIQQEGFLRLNNTFWPNPSTSAWINIWPPLYPMILSLGGVIGIDPIPWARVVSVASLTGAALLTYGIGWTVLRSRAGAWSAGMLFVAVPSTTGAVFGLAHSESVFTVMLLGMVWLLLPYRFGDATSSNRPALWAALIASFTLITRYIAVGAVIGAGLYLALWAFTVRRPRRWWPASFFVLAAVPLGLWSLYLKVTTGSLTGGQPSSDPLTFEHIPESLRQITIELLHGFGFLTRLLTLQSNWWALAVAGLFFAVVLILLLRTRVPVRSIFGTQYWPLVFVSVAYLVTYWILAAPSGPIIADWRHYVPIYPLLLILVVRVVSRAGIPTFFGVAVLGLFLASGATAVLRHSEGLFWNQPSWRESALLRQLPELVRDGALVHSNETPYLLLQLGLDTTTRVFGGDAGFREVACTDLTYPEGYSYAVFVVIDTPFLRESTPGEVAAFYRQWAAPCGEVESIVNDSFLAVTTVRLSGR